MCGAALPRKPIWQSKALFAISADSTRYADPGEAQKDFQDRIKRYGLADRVTWEGLVEGETKEALLRNAHFFVLPTSYLNEGQPIAIIEGLAFGCAVISTRHCTIPEMLADGKAGILLDSPAPQSIADAITSLADRPNEFRRLSEAAMEQYADSFTRELHETNLLEVLTADH